MRRRILYIINPKSGLKKNPKLPAMIREVSEKHGNDFEIKYTETRHHATEMSAAAEGNGFDIVAIAGGDGSVNEAACGLKASGAALGIIPAGSGNGLARHLKIPLNHRKALELINTGVAQPVDTMEVNRQFCIGTMGLGFDGHIAHLFAHAARRGYYTYVKLVLTEFYKYKPAVYTLSVDGREWIRECFLLTVANSSQFGNNAIIAPFADSQDGVLDVSIIEKFPLWKTPGLIYKLMNDRIQFSQYFMMSKGREIVVRNNGILQGHIDGEPVTFKEDVHVKVIPSSVRIIKS